MARRSITLLLGSSLILGSTLTPAAGEQKTPEEMTLKDLRQRTITVTPGKIAEDARARSLEGYQTFLESPLGGAMRREALRRVADAMVQQLESAEEQSVSEGGDKPWMPLIKDASYDKALELYNEALTKYPHFPGNEHILYQMARSYEANGEPKQAIWALQQIQNNHPDCEYIDEANFRLAELGFLTQQFDLAAKNYQPLIDKGPETQFYKIALYKAGWSLFKKKGYHDALDKFIQLLDYMTAELELEQLVADIPELSAGEQEMIKDTLRVIGITVTHQEEPLPYLKNYLAGLNEPRNYEFMIYQALGDIYYTQELYQDAAQAYGAFTQRNPMHPQAPFFQLMAIETFTKGRFADQAAQASEVFANSYGFATPFWSEDKPEVLREQLAPYLRSHLGRLAQHYHAKLQADRNVENKTQALHWYRGYLDSSPKDSESARINFLLAELLYETGDYQAAAFEYNKAAYSYGRHPDAKEAAYAAILAYDKYKEQLTPEEQQAWRRQSVENALLFAKVYSDDPRVPDIVTKTAQDLFEVGAYETAIKAATVVLSLPNKKPEMIRSAQLVLGHSYFEKQQYRKAEEAYQQALNQTPENHQEHDGIYQRVAASIYKQGEVLRDKDNLRGAIREFQRVVRITPQSGFRDTANYDAATAMLTLKDWQPAIGILEKMRDSTFGRKHELEIIQKLTVAYLATDQDRKAAAELEKLGLLATTDDLKREAIWRAAELYEKSGDIPGTINAFESYTRRYPQPVDANIEARYKLAKLYQQNGDMGNYSKRLNDVIAADQQAGDQRTSRTRFLAGQSSMDLANIAFDNYTSVKIVAPVRQNLQKKKDYMQAAITAYGTASEYGIAELLTAATFQIAEIYRDFAKALLESDRPGDLDGDELEMYDIVLEEQAFPFEEKAIDLHEKNYQRITENIYDQWVKKSIATLGMINPGRYQKIEKAESYIENLN